MRKLPSPKIFTIPESAVVDIHWYMSGVHYSITILNPIRNDDGSISYRPEDRPVATRFFANEVLTVNEAKERIAVVVKDALTERAEQLLNIAKLAESATF